MEDSQAQFKQVVDFITQGKMIGPFVEVKPMGEKPGYPQYMRRVKQKACYANAALFVLGWPQARYILGYAAGPIPVEHAWVELDGDYHDPTWEKYTAIGQIYMAVAVLSNEALCDWLWEGRGQPPCLFDLYRVGKLASFAVSPPDSGPDPEPLA